MNELNTYHANENFFRKGIHKTRYTSIHFDDIGDVYTFGMNISQGFIDYFRDIKSAPYLIDERIDTLIQKTGSSMGYHNLVGFSTNIVLVKTKNEILSLRRKYDIEAKTVMNTEAFYVPKINVIFMAVENTDINLLKHEIIHVFQYLYTGECNEEQAYKLMHE